MAGEGIALNAALHAQLTRDADAPCARPVCFAVARRRRRRRRSPSGAAPGRCPTPRAARPSVAGRTVAARPRAGRERHADRRDRRAARAARPGRLDRAGHGVPGEQDPQPRPTATVTRSGCSSSGRRRAGARATQIRDPYYSINAFYDALEKIDGYQSMRITEAAQKVQRSGFPEAYEDHAADARALASALTGYSPGGGSAACSQSAHEPTPAGPAAGDRRLRRRRPRSSAASTATRRRVRRRTVGTPADGRSAHSTVRRLAARSPPRTSVGSRTVAGATARGRQTRRDPDVWQAALRHDRGRRASRTGERRRLADHGAGAMASRLLHGSRVDGTVVLETQWQLVPERHAVASSRLRRWTAQPSRATAAATRSSVAVNATRTWRSAGRGRRRTRGRPGCRARRARPRCPSRARRGWPRGRATPRSGRSGSPADSSAPRSVARRAA